MHNLKASGLPIRDDLVAARMHLRGIVCLKAGTWLTAERRVAVAAEARQAWVCAFCQLQKEALTPNSVTGTHTSLGLLADVEVELVHRIVSDPGRLSEAWYGSIIEQGLSRRNILRLRAWSPLPSWRIPLPSGSVLKRSPLPSPQGEAPSNYHSPGAKKEAAWVPIIEPEDAVDSDGMLYPSNKVGYIHRALSASA